MRLTEAGGHLELALAPAGRAGGRNGRSIWAAVSHTGIARYLSPGARHAFEPPGLLTQALRCRYAIGEELCGTYGAVTRGRCLQSGREVALKRLSLEPPKGWLGRSEGSNAMRQLLRDEVSILRELREASPHVVQLLDYVEEAHCGCLVLELLPSGDLFTQVAERYRRQGGYSEHDARQLLRMALSGLAVIHEHHVVHRDLRPESILLRAGERLELRIADFGLALRLDGPHGKTRGSAGSGGYLAPEVLRCLPYSYPADVWSVGALLYTLLCGRSPFALPGAESESARSEAETEGGTEVEAEVEAIRDGCWSFSDPSWSEVSVEAKDAVRRLLSAAPHKRPSAQDACDLPWLRQQPWEDAAEKLGLDPTAAAPPLAASPSILAGSRRLLRQPRAHRLRAGSGGGTAAAAAATLSASVSAPVRLDGGSGHLAPQQQALAALSALLGVVGGGAARAGGNAFHGDRDETKELSQSKPRRLGFGFDGDITVIGKTAAATAAAGALHNAAVAAPPDGHYKVSPPPPRRARSRGGSPRLGPAADPTADFAAAPPSQLLHSAGQAAHSLTLTPPLTPTPIPTLTLTLTLIITRCPTPSPNHNPTHNQVRQILPNPAPKPNPNPTHHQVRQILTLILTRCDRS